MSDTFMGGRSCCVKSCCRRSHDHLGRKLPNGLTFHCFPAWRRNEGAYISELTRRRRAAWAAAVGRSNITFHHVPKSMRVCSRHFHTGKPAYEMLESDPDWVPSLHLGHSEGNTRRTTRLPPSVQLKKVQKQSRATETRPAEITQGESGAAGDGCGAGAARPMVRPWSEVKSLLQFVLQRKTSVSEKPETETHDQPNAAKNTDLNFRDFFRNSLEASLDAFSWSRAHSQKSSSVPGELQVALNFNLPPQREDLSSSSCLNCVRLQRRIEELEEKLFRVTQTSAAAIEVPIESNQVLQSPDQVHAEEEGTEWMQPLSPPLLHEGGQDMDSTNQLASSSLAVQRPSEQKFRPRPPFNPAWLKMFWFLRYSPSLDKMWCHVCRVYADHSHQNLGLIRGSRVFKLDSIKKHSKTIYHEENLKRHSDRAEDLRLHSVRQMKDSCKTHF